jgi:hypothetical protein
VIERSLSAPKKRRAVSRPSAAPAHAGPIPTLQGRPRSLIHTPRPSAGLYVCTSDLDHAQIKLSFARPRCPMRPPGGQAGRPTQVLRPGCGPDLTGCQSLGDGNQIMDAAFASCEAPSGRLGSPRRRLRMSFFHGCVIALEIEAATVAAAVFAVRLWQLLF